MISEIGEAALSTSEAECHCKFMDNETGLRILPARAVDPNSVTNRTCNFFMRQRDYSYPQPKTSSGREAVSPAKKYK